MNESILATIKKMLGLGADYTAFDMDIIVLINGAFMTLHQLAIGPEEGFSIRDYSSKWSEFLTNEINIRAVQEYIYMKVRMTFDPPGNAFVMTAFEQQCKELEWRLCAQAESIKEFEFMKEKRKPFIPEIGHEYEPPYQVKDENLKLFV